VTDVDPRAAPGTSTSFEKALAWLIGIAALTAAILLVVQVDGSAHGTRAGVRAGIVSSELTTAMTATAEVARFRLASSEWATLGGMAGISRQIAGLETSDTLEVARGEAEADAADRLVAIAEAMAAFPSADGPLDPYAKRMLTVTGDELRTLVGKRTALLEVDAPRAGRQSSLVVVALSLVALAAVLAGLASTLHDGRPGRATLVTGFVTAAVAIALGVAALV
jgi:hypothetical protein